MNRRDFFRRSALIAAGAVAADQLELIERLGWKRRWFPGWRGGGTISVATPYGIPAYPEVQLVDQFGRVLQTARVIDGVARFPTILGGDWARGCRYVYASSGLTG